MDNDTNLKNRVANLKQKPQNCTCFPNDTKRIDYVIVYNQNDGEKNETEKEPVRQVFFQKLREDGLDVEFIKFKTGKENHTYVLLHCPIERFMIEAERTNHEMKIDKVMLNLIFKDEIGQRFYIYVKTMHLLQATFYLCIS